jgi:hypothetical protein
MNDLVKGEGRTHMIVNLSLHLHLCQSFRAQVDNSLYPLQVKSDTEAENKTPRKETTRPSVALSKSSVSWMINLNEAP